MIPVSLCCHAKDDQQVLMYFVKVKQKQVLLEPQPPPVMALTRALLGVSDAGFIITGQPAAIAGAIFRVPIAAG